MPNTNYAILIKQAAEQEIGAVVFRNPATLPVDATAGAPNRLDIDHFMDAGLDSPEDTAVVTAATNATPIVLTTTLDGSSTFAVGDLVEVENAGGNTNANGTFFLSAVAGSGTSMTLEGSAGNAAWTSGGKVRKLNKAKSFHIALATATAAVLNDKADGN